MSILEPSATANDRQVWPRLPKPGEQVKTPPKPRAEREPVTLDEIEVGDTLSFIGEDRRYVVGEQVGEVVQINEIRGQRAVAMVATGHGRYPLTRKHWERRSPRR